MKSEYFVVTVHTWPNVAGKPLYSMITRHVANDRQVIGNHLAKYTNISSEPFNRSVKAVLRDFIEGRRDDAGLSVEDRHNQIMVSITIVPTDGLLE